MGVGWRLRQGGVFAEELQFTGLVGGAELVQEQAPKQPREHPHGQEEARPAGDPARAIQRDPAPGHDAVHMGVVGQGGAPGMQHRREADPGPQVARVSGDGQQRLGGGRKQQTVDHRLVVVG